LTNFLLDTSALAKLYHEEAGSEYLERLLERSGSRFFISRLSLVELESVLSIKLRTQEISSGQAAIARRRLAADLNQRRFLLGPEIQEKHYNAAARLLATYGEIHGLRTLDAIQLAVISDRRQTGVIAVIVSSDHRLCRVAELLGCSSLDPANPGPLVR